MALATSKRVLSHGLTELGQARTLVWCSPSLAQATAQIWAKHDHVLTSNAQNRDALANILVSFVHLRAPGSQMGLETHS